MVRVRSVDQNMYRLVELFNRLDGINPLPLGRGSSREIQLDSIIRDWRPMALDIVSYMKSKGFRIKYIGGVVRTFCPFPEHKETKPSFTLYPHDNSYHCFGCKEHGSILQLMRLFGDPVSPELIDEEKRVRALTDIKKNPILKDKILRATGILLRIRRMRKWYKNQRKLNRIMYNILEVYKGVNIEIPTSRRRTYSTKRRRSI